MDVRFEEEFRRPIRSSDQRSFLASFVRKVSGGKVESTRAVNATLLFIAFLCMAVSLFLLTRDGEKPQVFTPPVNAPADAVIKP